MKTRQAMLVIALMALVIVQSASVAGSPQRDVFFGETHLHTTWSLDACAISGKILNGPEEAYR